MSIHKAKKILVISFSDLKRDPRVNRALSFLKNHYDVSALGLNDPCLDGVEFFPIHTLPPRTWFQWIKRFFLYAFRLFEKLYWSRYDFDNAGRTLSQERFDLIIANEIDSLPFAISIAKGSKILLDTHEYTPTEFDDQVTWRVVVAPYRKYLCRRYIQSADAMTTVSPGIAEEYWKEFNIARPVVVMNAPSFSEISPTRTGIRRVNLVHHGLAGPSRRIEDMIVMMDYLDERFILHLMLVKTQENYYQKIIKMAHKRSNIKLIQPTSYKEIIPAINRYDIGLFILRPQNVNSKFVLPNKFFEFIQARLAVAVGPSPEMARFVKRYDCGLVFPTFDPKDAALMLNKLTIEKIDFYKKRSCQAAKELSYENEFLRFDTVIKGLLDNST